MHVQLYEKESAFKKSMIFKDPLVFFVIIATFLSLFLFVIFPLYKITINSLIGSSGKISFENFIKVFSNKYYLQVFINSMELAISAAILSTIIGYIFAYAIVKTDIPYKGFFKMIATLPIISPPFVLSLAIIMLFGRNGLITRNLLGITTYNVYGFKSLLLIQVISFFPIAYLTLSGMLQAMDSAVEDAALSLGASKWKVFATVTLPLSIPGILSSLLLVMVQSLQDFSNPMIIGGDFSTLAVQSYIEITGLYNLSMGSTLSMVLLLPALTAFLLQKYWASGRSFVTVTGKPSQIKSEIRDPSIQKPLFILCILISLSIIFLYGTVLYGAFVKTWGINYEFTTENFRYVFSLGFEPIKNSFTLAVISTPVSGIISMVIAYLVEKRRFVGRKAMEFISLMTFAVPGTVIGIGYILAFNQKPLLLTGTATILIVAFVFRNMPVGIESGIAALKQIDNSIEEASTNLGADSFTTFRRIHLPLLESAFFSSLVYAFVHAMTAVSTVIFLISPRWNLMTTAVLSQVEMSKFSAAAAYVSIMLVIIIAVIKFLDFSVSRLDKRSELSL